jgi:DNA-binding phage protein
MGKIKTSGKRKVSIKNTQSRKVRKIKPNMGIDLYDPTERLLDEDRIGRAIWECFKNDDAEGVIEVIKIHLNAVNKAHLAKEANLSKTTLYHTLRSKNPTVKTLARIIHACIAA